MLKSDYKTDTPPFSVNVSLTTVNISRYYHIARWSLTQTPDTDRLTD